MQQTKVTMTSPMDKARTSQLSLRQPSEDANDKAIRRNFSIKDRLKSLVFLSNNKHIVICFTISWFPLMLYVMAGADNFEELARMLLLPSLISTIVLYLSILKRIKDTTVAIIGLSLVFFWFFLSISSPFLPLLDPNEPIAPYVPLFTFVEKLDTLFLLGTDYKGRDMLSRLIWGSQRVIVWGVTATFVSYIIGIIFGLVSGYLGKKWDIVISFLANVILSFPVMILFILVLGLLGASGWNILIAVTFASSPAIMRIIRGLTLDTKTKEYVFAAQTRGESSLYIMFFEILPNVRSHIIVDACLRLGYTTVAITTLTFLGLGLQPPDPDWGLMIREARSSALILKFSYMLILPTLAVSSLILGFNMLADGLREISLKT